MKLAEKLWRIWWLILVVIVVVAGACVLVGRIPPLFEYYQLEGIVLLIFGIIMLNYTKEFFKD